ncbi:restriction endonuclease subunit S [Paremcibacter congregatus]|uniref:restriction endonuclease subunit S n=1 Tax=Paremcibacter congregatus TaxID=2043170 RepID=UPI0030EF2339
MIPKGWRLDRLGKVCEFQRGFDLPTSIRREGRVPIISSSGISGYHEVAKVQPPGLVTGRYGTIGKLFFVHEPYWPLNTALWVKDFHGNDPSFLYYLLSKFDFKKFSDKTGVPGVNRNDLHAVRVLVPSKTEQKRIAEILSTWDRAIETTEKLIANSEAQKKALMQQLLTGKKRLPGFSGAWTRKHFADAVTVDQDSLGQATPADYRFRYISLSDVTPGKIADELGELEFGTAPSRARRKVKSGDILMATVRPNLQAFAKVSDQFSDYIASTGFAVLGAKAGFHPDYIYHYLFSEHLTGQIEALVVGSNYPAINSSDIKGMAMRCPSYEEQAAIAAVLTDAEGLIAQYHRQATDLHHEKSALMQQLLAGKRRVKIKEEEAA